MSGAHQNQKIAKYEPLSTPDYKEKGFDFVGDPIIVDAMRRWPKVVETYQGTYEDFLREAYLREARLQEALVVSLETGDPLTEAEVRVTDPFVLSCFYDDGTFSKTWDAKTSPPNVGKPRAKRISQIRPSSENIVSEFRFHGTSCPKCGGTLRYIKSGSCIPCSW